MGFDKTPNESTSFEASKKQEISLLEFFNNNFLKFYADFGNF